MMQDNAFANCEFFENLQGGDTGKRKIEHRSFALLWFTHNLMRTGQKGLWFSNRLMEMQIEMGPRGGIEPPSEEPQSSILPVDDLGHYSFLTELVHDLIGIFLLAYPSSLCLSMPNLYPKQIHKNQLDKMKYE